MTDVQFASLMSFMGIALSVLGAHLNARLNALKEVADTTKVLVDGRLAVVLGSVAVQADRIAALPDATEEEKEMAKLARAEYEHHKKTHQATQDHAKQ